MEYANCNIDKNFRPNLKPQRSRMNEQLEKNLLRVVMIIMEWKKRIGWVMKSEVYDMHADSAIR